MGLETLAIAGLALSAVSSFASIGQAQAQAGAAKKAAAANYQLQSEELTRRQKEENRLAAEKKSDVIRKADQQLGAVRTAQAEMGASPVSFMRLFSEVGGVEGLDLSRIEGNRKNTIEALQAGKKAAGQEYANTITSANNQYKAAVTSAALGFVSSGLQIGADYHSATTAEEIARNTRTQ